MIKLIIGYAYHGRSAGIAHGGYHLVTLDPINEGRLHRKPWDALCKPQGKFWYLEPRKEASLDIATCTRCIEIAERLAKARGEK